MTVKDLIRQLLDCPMQAEIVFGTEQGDYSVTGILHCGEQVTLDYEELVEAE